MTSSLRSASSSSNRAWFQRGALALLGLGAIVTACGDDGDDPAPPPVLATSTTAASGGGGTGGSMAASTTGAGAMDTGLGCDTDGRCEADEHCSCPDCWYRGDFPNCLSTSNCFDDGVCDASSDNNKKEGCHCPDCAELPECTDYCVSCQTKLQFNPNTEALCADSAVTFESLRAAACDLGSLCTTECGGTFCLGNFPNVACLECMEAEFPTELTACRDDINPRVRCNPMTGAPCNTAGAERCDRRLHGDVTVGFECFLQNAGSDTCEACLYDLGSTSYCGQGTTCLDDTTGQAASMGTCGAYCCEDSDCTAPATCEKGAFAPAAPGLGTCTLGATPADPECTPPEEPPTMGSCVTLDPL